MFLGALLAPLSVKLIECTHQLRSAELSCWLVDSSLRLKWNDLFQHLLVDIDQAANLLTLFIEQLDVKGIAHHVLKSILSSEVAIVTRVVYHCRDMLVKVLAFVWIIEDRIILCVHVLIIKIKCKVVKLKL
jgi:hypothetical protein